MSDYADLPGVPGLEDDEAVPDASGSVCSCGDRSRPHINHRVRIPCWTYIGQVRVDVDERGEVDWTTRQKRWLT